MLPTRELGKAKAPVFEWRDNAGNFDLTGLVVWIVLILMIGILPLSDFVGHSHWEYIKWVPTADDLRSPAYLFDIFTDIVGNTALFVPIGFFLSRLLFSVPRSRQLLFAAGLSAVLSLSIEFYQVYCHSRFPSLFDVATNVLGALLGVHFVHSRKNASVMSENTALTPIPPDHSPAP
jgi:glycopeptide antibiotics resistance protein